MARIVQLESKLARDDAQEDSGQGLGPPRLDDEQDRETAEEENEVGRDAEGIENRSLLHQPRILDATLENRVIVLHDFWGGAIRARDFSNQS